MNVFEGSAYELEEWFHDIDTQHTLLCFLVAACARDRTLFQKLTDEVVDMDVRFGEDISFMLFQEPVKQDSEETPSEALSGISFTGHEGREVVRKVISGEFVYPAAKQDKTLPRAIDRLYNVHSKPGGQNLLYLERQAIIVSSSHKIVPDLCSHFGIPSQQLPAIVVLAKGIKERFLFPLGQEPTYEKVARFVPELASVLQESNDLVQSVFEMKRQVAMLQDAVGQMDRRQEYIEKTVAFLCKKYRLPMEPFISFFKAIDDRRPGLSLRGAIGQLNIPNADKVLKEQRITKVDRFLREISDIDVDLRKLIDGCPDDLRAAMGRQLKKSGEIAARLNKIELRDRNPLAPLRAVGSHMKSLSAIAEKINLWSDIAEKVHKYWP